MAGWAQEWETITQTPEYQTSSDADREVQRQQYFDQNIAPNFFSYEQGEAREIFDQFTAPQGDPSSGTLNDLRLAFQSGVAGGFADLAQGATLGHSNTVSDWLRERADDYTLSMSPSMIEDISNTGFTYSQEEGVGIKEGSTAQGAAGLFFQGGGSLLPSMMPGMAAGKALSMAGRGLAGTSTALSTATKAKNASMANQAYSRAKLIDSTASATGFGLVGGAMMTGGVANQSYEEVMNLPQETIEDLEPYQRQFVELRSQGLTDEQAAQQARESVAQEASRANLGKAGVIGFLSSALTGPIEAKLLTGAGGATRASNIARGMATEMAQESVESSAQPYLSNLSVASVGVDRDPWEGVVGETLTGMAIGGGIGGILGGVSKPNVPKSKATLDKEYEGFKAIERNLLKTLNDPEVKGVKRNKAEVQLGETYRALYEIKEQHKKAPTLEQLGESQNNQAPTPAAETPPVETPDRRNYVPHDVVEQLAEAERGHRQINSDYARAMGNKGQGSAETAQQFENDLKASEKTIDLFRLLQSNVRNQQYFPTQQDFDQYIHRKLNGGLDGRLADIELEARKANRSVDEAVANYQAAEQLRQGWQAEPAPTLPMPPPAGTEYRPGMREAVKEPPPKPKPAPESKAPAKPAPAKSTSQIQQLKAIPSDYSQHGQVRRVLSDLATHGNARIHYGDNQTLAIRSGKADPGKLQQYLAYTRKAVAREKQQQQRGGALAGVERMLRRSLENYPEGDVQAWKIRSALNAIDEGKTRRIPYGDNQALQITNGRYNRKALGEFAQHMGKEAKKGERKAPAAKPGKTTGKGQPTQKGPTRQETLSKRADLYDQLRSLPESARQDWKYQNVVNALENRGSTRLHYGAGQEVNIRKGLYDPKEMQAFTRHMRQQGKEAGQRQRQQQAKQRYQKLTPATRRILEKWKNQGEARKEFARQATHLWTNPETGDKEPVIYRGSNIFPGLDLYSNIDNEDITGSKREFIEITGRDRQETQEQREARETAERKKELLEESQEQEEQRQKERQAIIDRQNAIKPYPESEATHVYKPKGGEAQLIKPIDRYEIGTEGWYRRPNGKATFLGDQQKRIKSFVEIEKDKQRQKEAVDREERREQLKKIEEQHEKERLEREHAERFNNEFSSPVTLTRFLTLHGISIDPEKSGLYPVDKKGKRLYLADINDDRLTALQLTRYIDAVKEDGFHPYPAVKVERDKVAKITQKHLADKELIGNGRGNPWNKKHQAEMQLKNKGLQETHYVSGDDVFWIKKKPDISHLNWGHISYEHNGAIETIMVPEGLLSTEQSDYIKEIVGERKIRFTPPKYKIIEQTAWPDKGTGVFKLKRTNRTTFLEKVSTSEKPVKKTPESIQVRQGEIGQKLEQGEIVLTATDRQTTPFPKIDLSSPIKAQNTEKRINKWLMGNALAEAEARGDEYNARMFRAENNEKPPQASKDHAESYLFDKEFIVETPPAILKPLAEPETRTEPLTLEQQGLAKQQADIEQRLPGAISKATAATRELLASFTGDTDKFIGDLFQLINVASEAARGDYDNNLNLKKAGEIREAIFKELPPETQKSLKDSSLEGLRQRRPDSQVLKDVESGKRQWTANDIVKEMKWEGVRQALAGLEGATRNLKKIAAKITAEAEGKPATIGQKPAARQERTKRRKRKLLQIDEDLSKAGDELADVFRKEMGKVGSGLDPLVAAKVLQHGMKVGTLYVQKGAIKFADWADNMLGLMESKGINERDVAPHLKSLYMSVASSEQLTEAQADDMDSLKNVRAFNLETLMVEPAPQEAEKSPTISEAKTPEKAPPIPEKSPTISGNTATVTVPDTGQKLQVQYKLVENADVVASHNAKGDLNPAYPSELQPRDRSRQASEDQIHTLAGKWDPDRAVGSVMTSDGAPIVNEANQVESGNGRTLALREVYKTKPNLAEKYKQYLIDHAADFGLDPAQIEAMNEPQLVRERQTELTPEQLRDYLEYSNEQEVAGKSTTEQATSDAKALTDDLMASFHPSEKGDLNTAGNQAFLGKFYQAIKGDKTNLQTEGGRFSKQFFQRLQGALFAKAYQDNDLINLVLEESTEGVENIVKALNVSAPAFARVQAKHDNLQDLNMVPALVQGIRVTREAKAANQAVDEYINQGDILSGETVEPMAALFAQFIDLNKQRHKQLGEAFVSLANMMDQELTQRGEPDIFGERQALSTSDIIKPLNQRLKEQGRAAGAATSGSLFNAAGRPTEAAQTQESGGSAAAGRLADQQREIEERQAAIAAKYAKDWLKDREQPPTSKQALPDLDDLLAGTAEVTGQLKALNPEAAAQLETQQKLDTLIRTAAESIDQLRGSDLERLYNGVDYGQEWTALDHHLRQERPDLETDITLAIENLISDQHTGFANKAKTFPGGWQLTSLTSEAAGGSEIKISAAGHDFSIRFDPHQNQFILRDQSGMELTAVNDMRDAIRQIKDFKENDHVPGTAGRVERDSRQPEAEVRTEPPAVQPEPGTEGSGLGGGIRPAAPGGIQSGSGGGIPAGQPATAGAQGNQSVHQTEQQTGVKGEPAGSPDRGRGRASDATGSPAQRPADQSTAIPAQSPALSLTQRLDAQKAAESIPVIRGDLDNIRNTLPVLLPEQQEDVAFMEKRLWENDERGGMLTNGTGTGKTFSGMGTIKRFVKEGKGNILIVTPTQGINSAWVKAGETMGVDINALPDIKSAGEGVVVTTYANLGDNNALSGRDWDLIVTDESHNLKESNDFDATKRLGKFRALTGHPSGRYTKAEMLYPDLVTQMEELPKQIKILSESDDANSWAQVEPLKEQLQQVQQQFRALAKTVRASAEKQWNAKQTKSLMLSATPFAHRKTIDYAEGFLFDYPSDDIQQGYYRQDGQTQFFMSNFGYRFRYGKLTEPDVDVDTGLMEREFNQKLKESGAMRSRMLEVEKDYDRKFELVEGGVGADVDAGIQWLDGQAKEARKANDDITYYRWYAAHAAINKRLDYHTKAYLMESIKAKAAVPYIKQHLALGRKAVVFHDYNTGGGLNPFQWNDDMSDAAIRASVDPRVAKEGFALIAKQRPDLLKLPLDQLENPRNTFIEAFGDQLTLYSGTESKKDRAAGLENFNDDNGSKQVILINSAAGNAGISLHDTTGQHQRLLLNLGIPVRPTFAIQIEGRTYRVGLQSNAMFRYMSTGLTMEKYMVSSKLAARAGTAENLAMGNDARALEDSFIESYKDAAVYTPGMEGEGMGGKARDRQLGGDVSDFDKAKTFYFAKQKRTAQTKSKEGRDYFATPEPLGLKVVEWLHAQPGDSLLEPSAGDGSIARWMPDHSTVTAVEPSYELAGQLSMNAPTAKIQPIYFEDLNLQNKYDGIAMNPPYGAASKLAVEHMAKAYNHLRDGGRMIAIIPQGPASETKLNKWLESKAAKDAHVTAEINLPPKTFDRAGTNVNTRILIIDRFNGEQHAVPARRTLDIQADTIKDFFDQIQDLEFGRQRIERTTEQRTAEISESPQQWLETKGIEVIDYGSGTVAFKGDTFKYKSVLKQQSATWDGDLKEWTIYGNDNTLTEVAQAIDTYLNSPLAEHKLLVSEQDGQYLVSGEGTRRHKGLLKKHGAKWDKQAVSWVMESDPTAMLQRELDGSSRYRLADTEAGQIHRKPYETRSLTSKINNLVGNLANVVDSVDNLPSHLREQIRNDDLGSRVKGLYDPRTDQVYIIANHAEGVRDAVRTAIHEAVGHKGLRGVLGDQINPVLDQIYNSIPDSQLRELREAYANQIAGRPQEEQRRIVAEEYLATLAEDQPSNNFVQRAIAKIRQWLRKIMPNMKWSDSEIRQLLGEASQYARQPADNRPGVEPVGTNPDRVDTPDGARYKLNLFSNRDSQQVKQEIGASARSMKEAVRAKALGFLGGRQITEIYRKVFDALIVRDEHGNIIRRNPLQIIGDLTQALSATRNEYANKADKVDQKFSKLAGDKHAYQLTADTMHQSTLLKQDPSKDYIPLHDLRELDSQLKSAVLAHDTKTMLDIKAKTKEELQRQKDYKELKTMYDGMGELGQEVYNDVRDYYQDMWKEQKQALKDRVDGMEMDPEATGKIKAQIEDMFHRDITDGPYFPLMRFGDFGVVATTPDGQPYREHFESQKDLEAGIRELEAQGYIVESSGKNLQFEPRQMSGVTQFSGKIYQALTSKKMEQIDMDARMAFMDEVNQIALSLLPELSAAKRSMHRKGIAGYDTNARRAFASTALHGANRLGRTRYGWQIESELNRMDKATDSGQYSVLDETPEDKIIGRSVAEEMRRRHDLNMNPNGHPLAANITQAAFLWYLGGSAAAGLVNLTQNILVALPQLGSRYGYTKSSRVMAGAARDYLTLGKRKLNGVDDFLGNAWYSLEDAKANKRISQDEIDMINALIKDGTIDITQAHTLANIAGADLKPEAQKSKDWYTKLMRASGMFFHNAEVANRQIAALTAYRLHKQEAAKSGKPFNAQAAIDYTRNAVFDAHFDYSSYNRPRHFKGNWAKVFLIFKQHSQNMSYILGKGFYDGVIDQKLKGTEEGKKQVAMARRALIGTLGLHALFAGVMGLPGMSVMLWAAGKAMGDEDDPVNPEVELRNFFADLFGAQNGHALAKGVFNGYLGIDLHQRTKLNDLWISSPNYDMPARQEAQHYVANGIGGPAVSQLVNMWVGMNEVTDGETMKGIQRMVPKFLRDGLKSWEYSQHGVLDRNGEPILEQLTPGQKFWQGAGFAPADISEGYAAKGAITGARSRIQRRRQMLLSQLDRAARTDDQRLHQKTMAEIDRFNEVQRAKGKDFHWALLRRENIRRSLSQRARRREESEQAVWLPQTQLGMRDLGRFALH